MTPERLAEIRALNVDSCSADAPYNPDVWALEKARTELLAELDRLRREMCDLHALWMQRARDNGDYYNRTGAEYEYGKAAAFDAAAKEIRPLAEPVQADPSGGA
ncbi:hypothetical protein ABZ917_17830 [Nonomuraea wenchangensis]